MPPAGALFCEKIYYTGYRISEAFTLRSTDIDPELHILHFRTLKKRERVEVRRVPVPESLTRQLFAPASPDEEQPLWQFSRTTGWRIIKRGMAKAKVSGIHRHDEGPNTTVEFRNVGNTLLIAPNINADRTVTLRLLQENSFISPTQAKLPVVTNNASGGSSSVQNVGVDVVSTRTISGTFVAKDNLAVAIGGLIQDNTNDTRAGVPLLDRIPVVGFFLRRTEKTKSLSELIIMIRPHIISTPSDSQAISQDVLQNLASPDSQRLLQEGLWPTDQPLPPLPSSPAGTKKAATPAPKVATSKRAVVK